MITPYALANPLSLLLNKNREDFTREDLLSVIETQQIERITFHYTALDGKLKELKIPVANRAQAERILADGERADGSSLYKGMVDVSVSDLYIVPVYKTAFLNPFDSGSLDFICRYITRTGDLAPFSMDSVLANAASRFTQATGLEMYALGELEFFLLSPNENQLYPAQKQRGYHASAPFVKSGVMLNEMLRYITQLTGAVKYAHSEVGYVERVRSDIAEIRDKQAEQLEIEFLPAPVTEAADNLVLARWLIRNTAYKHNCVATFAPKIEEDIAGNGMHIHMELRRNGKNIMNNEDGTLSEEANTLIGGLCRYASSLTAFGNTVSSAYLRLVPNQEAPTRICWSDMNRSAMIRVPLGWQAGSDLARKINPQQSVPFTPGDNRQTVELRSPDGSALIHLLIAGIASAADWAFSNTTEALALAKDLYVRGNIFHDKALLKKLPSLPKSCVESSKVLLNERALYEKDGVFPPAVIEYVAKLLQSEHDENMNSRLLELPADDRLHETRKIMHKDIHRH